MKTAVATVILLIGSAAAGFYLYSLLFADDATAPGTSAAVGNPQSAPAPVAPPIPTPTTQAKVTRRPTFTLPDLDGAMRSVTEWDGRPLLINFWATWCPPCRKEIPLLIELQDEYADRQLQIIGIAVDDPVPVRRFADEIGIDYPILVGEQTALDVADDFGLSVIGLPITVLTRADGTIVDVHQGELRRDEAVKMLGEL